MDPRILHLKDMHPDVDFGRQSKILDKVEAGEISHAIADQLIKASWPLCADCGAISAIIVDKRFYCIDHWEAASKRSDALQRALAEARAAAGGEVF